MKDHRPEFIIIGGGLSELVAAHVLSQRGAEVTLLDRSLPDGNGLLGGFTGFSGAKFSLPPAGQGLIPAAGSLERLQEAIADVMRLLDIRSRVESGAEDASADEPLAGSGAIRRYRTIVLTPLEIARTIEVVSRHVRESLHVIEAEATNSAAMVGIGSLLAATESSHEPDPCCLQLGGPEDRSFAMPAPRQEGKGVDLGVRVEFLDRRALQPLREHGPDAKILMGRTRTFCLKGLSLSIRRYQMW